MVFPPQVESWTLGVYGTNYLSELTQVIEELAKPFKIKKLIIVLMSEEAKRYNYKGNTGE